MLARQSKDTFIRTFGPYGYVTSQLTKGDRVYDEAGAAFLSVIGRSPRTVEDMATDLSAVFVDAEWGMLCEDILEFLSELEAEGFVVTGDDVAGMDARDPGFTYDCDLPKTAPAPLLARERGTQVRPTDELLLEYFRGEPTIFGAHVELTSACNERCIHCYQARSRASHADTSLIVDIFRQLRALGTLSVTLSGGEPTLHPDFVEILREARRCDFMINVLSNGARLSDAVIRALKETNVNMVQVSVYDTDPSIHDGITGVPGSHRATVDAVERLISADVPVQVSCPIMKENLQSYERVSAWCRERKIRVLSDFVLMARADFDTTNLDHRLDLAETGQVIRAIIAADDEYQMQIHGDPRARDLELFARQPVCGVCVDNVCFTHDGSMYPCSGFQGYLLGNVRERSVKDIWETSDAIRSVRSIRNESFPQCLRCEARDFCIMCLVRNYNESSGDMFAVAQHFCDVAFMNKVIVEEHLRDIGASPTPAVS